MNADGRHLTVMQNDTILDSSRMLMYATPIQRDELAILKTVHRSMHYSEWATKQPTSWVGQNTT